MSKTFFLKTSYETEAIGAQLAKSIQAPAVIFLEGQLGVGKTTLVRGFLREFGVNSFVKSPTFTLVETYDVGEVQIVHADLYRLKDARELEALGFRDYFTDNTICIIEWASRAHELLPKPQMVCTLEMSEAGDERRLVISEKVGV